MVEEEEEVKEAEEEEEDDDGRIWKTFEISRSKDKERGLMLHEVFNTISSLKGDNRAEQIHALVPQSQTPDPIPACAPLARILPISPCTTDSTLAISAVRKSVRKKKESSSFS